MCSDKEILLYFSVNLHNDAFNMNLKKSLQSWHKFLNLIDFTAFSAHEIEVFALSFKLMKCTAYYYLKVCLIEGSSKHIWECDKLPNSCQKSQSNS